MNVQKQTLFLTLMTYYRKLLLVSSDVGWFVVLLYVYNTADDYQNPEVTKREKSMHEIDSNKC